MPAVILSLEEAAQKIPTGACVAIQGSGGGVAEPTAMIRAIRQRFDREGAPRQLTLVHATGLGIATPAGPICSRSPDW